MNSRKAEEKKKHTFFKRHVLFFFQEITKLRKYYARFSLAKVDDQPVAELSVSKIRLLRGKLLIFHCQPQIFQIFVPLVIRNYLHTEKSQSLKN